MKQVGTVNGAGQWGARLRVNLPKGIKLSGAFRINGVHSVNPVTHQSTGQDQVFTIMEWFSAVGTADDVLLFNPAIIPPSFPYQNVDAIPVNNALIFWDGLVEQDHPKSWLRRLWDWWLGLWWSRFK